MGFYIHALHIYGKLFGSPPEVVVNDLSNKESKIEYHYLIQDLIQP